MNVDYEIYVQIDRMIDMMIYNALVICIYRYGVVFDRVGDGVGNVWVGKVGNGGGNGVENVWAESFEKVGVGVENVWAESFEKVGVDRDI